MADIITISSESMDFDSVSTTLNLSRCTDALIPAGLDELRWAVSRGYDRGPGEGTAC